MVPYFTGAADDDPTSTIDMPRLGRAYSRFSVAEVELLLAAARETKGWRGVRLVALLETLYATGLRVSELVSLKLVGIAGWTHHHGSWEGWQGTFGAVRRRSSSNSAWLPFARISS